MADSLPAAILDQIRTDLTRLHADRRDVEKRKRVAAQLDRGHGSCVLADPRCAEVVEQSLIWGDRERYRLLAWVVMPNHVHVLIEQSQGWPLARVVQSWKRHTSRAIHGVADVRAPSPLWQRDYWDRFVRNDRHFDAVVRYIEENPVDAGLVERAETWSWGSARFRGLEKAGDAECNSALPGRGARRR